MREGIYVGKRVDNGMWVQGYLFKCWGRAYILWGITNDVPTMHEVIPETVGQSTGLKDKNNLDVFKGEIVNVNGNIGYIEWDAVHARWGRKIKLTCKDGKRRYVIQGIGVQTKMEIIGNIHDNPELLT